MVRRATRAGASGASDGAAVRGAMRLLRSSPDCVAVGRANSGPAMRETPPFRLRDGALVPRVARGRAAERLRRADDTVFDPRRGGLGIAVPADASPHDARVLVERLDGAVFAR